MRISKKIIACVLAALMAISMMPLTAFAASDVQTEDSVASITANSVTTYYDSLAEAIAACPDDASSATTIKLLADVTTTSTTVINNGKNIKLNLNSKSITSANVDPMFKIEGGKLETTSNKGTIESTTNDCTVFRVVGKEDAEAEYSKLIIGNSTTVYGKEYGILIPQSNHYADGVYVKVNGKMETGLACIYTNGNINQYGSNPATILVSGSSSKLTCKDNKDNSYHDNAAVYAAGYAVWTFSSGSVTGPTALYAKCGTFDCRGTSFNGTGDVVAYSHNGNGITATGEAIVLENCAGYSDELNFSLTKGTVTSANADPIGSYAYSTGTDTRVAETGFVGVSSNGVGPACKSNGAAADVSEFYNADLAAKFALGNAYVENSELGGTEGLIRGEAPGAKVVRGDTVLYAGNVIGAANKCQPGETVYALKNFSTGSQVQITQDVTIDLQGYTITNTNSLYPIRVMDDASATITNGTVTSAKGLTVETDSKLVIAEDCTVNADIDNYNLSGVENSTTEIYGTVNGSVTASKTGSVVNVYEGAEINNESGTAINAKAGTTVNVYGGVISGAVTETGTGEVNISGGTFDTDVSDFVVEGSAQDPVTGEVIREVEDTMSITVADNIDLNINMDTADERVETIEYTFADPNSQEEDATKTVTKSAKDDVTSFTVALSPAQIEDEITAVAKDENGDVIREVTTSIADYCNTIITTVAANPTAFGAKSTELAELAKSTLDYGKAASDYFDYNTAAYTGYTTQLDDPTSAIADLAETAGKGSYDHYLFRITSVSYVATSVPELRFYFESDNFTQNDFSDMNEYITCENGTAKFVKLEGTNQYILQIKNINITDFTTPVVVRLGGTGTEGTQILNFTPIVWVNAAIKKSGTALGELGKAIGNYYLASDAYFEQI